MKSKIKKRTLMIGACLSLVFILLSIQKSRADVIEIPALEFTLLTSDGFPIKNLPSIQHFSGEVWGITHTKMGFPILGWYSKTLDEQFKVSTQKNGKISLPEQIYDGGSARNLSWQMSFGWQVHCGSRGFVGQNGPMENCGFISNSGFQHFPPQGAIYKTGSTIAEIQEMYRNALSDAKQCGGSIQPADAPMPELGN